MTGAAPPQWRARTRWRHGVARWRHRLERWWRAGLGRQVTPGVLRYVRWGATATWAVAFGVDCYYRGIHLDRTGQLYWLALGLLAATIGQRRFFYVVVDFVPFAAVLIGYDLLRGGADTLGMPTWWTPQLDVDKFLFGGSRANAGWLLAAVVTLVAGRIERTRAARRVPDTLNTLPPARRDAPPAAPTDEYLDEPTLETPCLPMTSVPETTPSSI